MWEFTCCTSFFPVELERFRRRRLGAAVHRHRPLHEVRHGQGDQEGGRIRQQLTAVGTAVATASGQRLSLSVFIIIILLILSQLLWN